ncbi:conserved hypothetical protein [Yersinia pestis KIM D27]|nr:conserved hypothetical protein [Yersinia pestis KIM D27]
MVAACQNENNGLIVFIGMWISSNKADKSGKTDKKAGGPCSHPYRTR